MANPRLLHRWDVPDHPVLPRVVDHGRVVDPNSGVITDQMVKPRGPLRWLVVGVSCPYCGGRHEHPMASRSRKAWYPAPCSSDRRVGYYVVAGHDPGDAA